MALAATLMEMNSECESLLCFKVVIITVPIISAYFHLNNEAKPAFSCIPRRCQEQGGRAVADLTS